MRPGAPALHSLKLDILALERHYRDGLDWHEVGHELGLRANGIKTLAQRARRVLRDCIERSKQ